MLPAGGSYMSRKEAIAQYSTALSEGKNYYKLAVSRGEYPYPPALDYIVHPGDVLDQVDIGLVNIPSELIAGKNRRQDFRIGREFYASSRDGDGICGQVDRSL